MKNQHSTLTHPHIPQHSIQHAALGKAVDHASYGYTFDELRRRVFGDKHLPRPQVLVDSLRRNQFNKGTGKSSWWRRPDAT